MVQQIAEAFGYNAAHDLLEHNLVPSRAGKVAIIDETGSYTFAELAERANRCANVFANLEIQRGERILLVLLDTVDFPSCFLGAIRAGIVPIPLSTMLQPEDYAHVLSDSGAVAAIVSSVLLSQVEEGAKLASWRGKVIVAGETAAGVSQLSELMRRASKSFATHPTLSSDPCFWLYSSGSTGKPKGAVHRQTSMAQTAELFAQGVLGLQETDLIYSAAKLFFAYGLGNALSFPLAVGATSVLYPGRAKAAAVCDVLRKFRPTIFCGVPTLFAALLACENLPKRKELALRLCVSAGEALPEQLGRTWTERTGVEIVDGIGSTEMLHIFVSNRPGTCRYGTTGKPVPGYKVRLISEDGNDAAPGEMGDLLVSGPTAATCYWNNPEKTRSTFLGDWVKTGDRFRITPEGDYVYCGRSDEMLKVSGVWVSPTEVEAALIAHESVLEAAIVGAADEAGLIKPKAFVVLKPGAAPHEQIVASLKEFVKSRLAPYKCPRWIEFVDELPKTPTGKIRRNVLRLASSQKAESVQRTPSVALPEARDVVVDGKRLETLRFPAAHSESGMMFMLHEGLGSVAMWRDFPQQIAEGTGCGVMLYSRYGHGKSQALGEKRSVDFMHHEAKVVLPALLERFQIDQPILLGHSDGGSIAVIYAGTWPDRVKALVLEAPHVFVEDFGLRSIRQIGELYKIGDLPLKLGRYHDHADEMFWGWNEIWLDPKFREWNIESYLKSITCPVLLMQGEHDEYGTLAQVNAIKKALPSTEVAILPSCGHSPHRDQPAKTLEMIASFIARLKQD